MKLYSNKWFFQRIIYILFTLLFVGPVVSHPDDEMDFFNVGQGHAVLIRKGGINETTEQPYAPLLIDAGATAHPFKMGERYEWIKDDVTSLSSKRPPYKTFFAEHLADLKKRTYIKERVRT